MLLSAESLLNFNILEPNGLGEPQQIGYDLTLKSVSKIIGGEITKHKSFIEDYILIEPINNSWSLSNGVYSLTFHQGVDLTPKNCRQFTGFVRHRSSILRCGSLITSGIFDSGFICDNIGATLFVFNDIKIEQESRIAQFYVIENEPTKNLYNGNYQGNKDLK